MTDQSLLTPGTISGDMAHAERLVLEAGSNWKTIKQRHLQHSALMRFLLAYRRYEVGRVYKQVIAEMAEQLGDKGFRIGDLQLTAAGSEDLTSDYDVTFDHPPDKPWIGPEAVVRFNRLFRRKWGKESATVFDTNVYTQGFMPFNMSNIPFGMPGALEGRKKQAQAQQAQARPEEADEYRQVLARLDEKIAKARRAKGQAVERAVGERLKTEDSRALAAMVTTQDIMALVKIRKFMSKGEWRVYAYMLASGIEDATRREETRARLEAADAMFTVLQAEFQQKKGQILAERARSGEPVDQEDIDLEVNNRLYEQYQRQVQATLGKTGGLEAEDYVRWTEAESKGRFFANEAYHTAGPLEAVVLGQQMGIQLPLSPAQYVQSVNEQTGFMMEQYREAHGEIGKFLWKSAKYVDRITSAVEELGQKFPQLKNNKPPKLDAIKTLGQELLAIKKRDAADDVKSAAALEKLAQSPVEDMKAEVLELSQRINQMLRRLM